MEKVVLRLEWKSEVATECFASLEAKNVTTRTVTCHRTGEWYFSSKIKILVLVFILYYRQNFFIIPVFSFSFGIIDKSSFCIVFIA